MLDRVSTRWTWRKIKRDIVAGEMIVRVFGPVRNWSVANFESVGREGKSELCRIWSTVGREDKLDVNKIGREEELNV